MRLPSEDLLDLARFAATPIVREPFDYMVLPGFIPEAAAAAVCASFPPLDHVGIVPAPAHAPDAFGSLLDALRSPEVTQAFSAKFGISLWPESLMITLRARCRLRDGGIHTDSENKLVTALIYLNTDWSAPGGRLRLLRGPDDLDDVIAEVPPVAGTLLAFRRSANSWHGHHPFEGQRRSIMLNWMSSPLAARLESLRHLASSGLKHLVA